jgi:hypothetical protein
MNIFAFTLFVAVSLLSFIPSSLLIADGGSPWSYGSNENVGDGPASKRSFNPWTGEMSGPKANSQAEQFQYGEERQMLEPLTLDELYPKHGDSVKRQRPWGRVPQQFQNRDSDPYGYGRRETRSKYRRDTKQWPDLNFDDGGSDSYGDDRFPPTYQQYRRGDGEQYSAPSQQNYRRGYAEGYPSSDGQLFNDLELGSDGWQGAPSSYRNYNYLPRH